MESWDRISTRDANKRRPAGLDNALIIMTPVLLMLNRPTPDALILAYEQKIRLVYHEMIRYMNHNQSDIIQQFKQLTSPDVIVFTSARDVEAALNTNLAQNIDKQTIIACSGSETERKLRHYGYPPMWVGTGTGESLADVIVEQAQQQPIRHVLHFTGSVYNKILQTKLLYHAIDYQTIMVYQGVRNPVAAPLEGAWGLGICSSECARVLFNTQPEAREIPIFAIGPTTATTLQQLGFSQVYMANETRQVSVVERFVQHFDLQAQIL